MLYYTVYQYYNHVIQFDVQHLGVTVAAVLWPLTPMFFLNKWTRMLFFFFFLHQLVEQFGIYSRLWRYVTGYLIEKGDCVLWSVDQMQVKWPYQPETFIKTELPSPNHSVTCDCNCSLISIITRWVWLFSHSSSSTGNILFALFITLCVTFKRQISMKLVCSSQSCHLNSLHRYDSYECKWYSHRPVTVTWVHFILFFFSHLFE